MNTPVDLVEKDYYAKEIDFQTQINKHTQALSLGDNVLLVQQTDQFIHIHINHTPVKKINILFYYPNNALWDTLMPFNSVTDISINKTPLHKGKVHLKIEWTDDTRAYYIEKTMVIY